ASVLALYRAGLRERADWLRSATARERWEVQAFGELLALRYRPVGGRDRLLLAAIRPASAAAPWKEEPLLRPPPGRAWTPRRVSRDYGQGPELPAPNRLDFSQPLTALMEAAPA